MADDTANKAYPFMFDPSQFSNKYSPFAGMSLNPFMGQYNGGSTGPTDAHGNPIGSYQDTQKQHDAWAAAHPAQMAAPVTLNSNAGLEAQGSQARAMQDAGYGDWAMLDPMMAQSSRPGATAGAGSVGATSGWNPNNSASIYPTSAGGQAGAPYRTANLAASYDARGNLLDDGRGHMVYPQQPPQQQATPQAAAPQNPYDMGQAYLQALQSPGHVTTPGATVPQASAPTGQSGVLQQFLSNWQQGGGNTQGAGNYNNAGMFNALKGMV
jgi:hypothetical protein